MMISIKWRIKLTQNFPQQGNGYDCGLFTCAAALCIMTKRAMNFTQVDMNNFRTQLAHILIKDSTTQEHTKALQQIKNMRKATVASRATNRNNPSAHGNSIPPVDSPDTNEQKPKRKRTTDKTEVVHSKHKKETNKLTAQANKRNTDDQKDTLKQTSIKKPKTKSKTEPKPKRTSITRKSKQEKFHIERKQAIRQQRLMRKFLQGPKPKSNPIIPSSPPPPQQQPPQSPNKKRTRTHAQHIEENETPPRKKTDIENLDAPT